MSSHWGLILRTSIGRVKAAPVLMLSFYLIVVNGCLGRQISRSLGTGVFNPARAAGIGTSWMGKPGSWFVPSAANCRRICKAAAGYRWRYYVVCVKAEDSQLRRSFSAIQLG